MVAAMKGANDAISVMSSHEVISEEMEGLSSRGGFHYIKQLLTFPHFPPLIYCHLDPPPPPPLKRSIMPKYRETEHTVAKLETKIQELLRVLESKRCNFYDFCFVFGWRMFKEPVSSENVFFFYFLQLKA